MQNQINTQHEDVVLQEWSDAYLAQFGSRPKNRYLKQVLLQVSPANMRRERLLAELSNMQSKMIELAMVTINVRLSRGANSIIRESRRMAAECRSSRSGSWGRELSHATK